jgi:type IV secretory pathway TraG/TraD family ATPase VirD4
VKPYSHSQTLRNGEETSQSLSKQAVHLLTPRDINELDLDEIIAFHSHRKPITAKRMDWRTFPILKQRRAMPPPPFKPLPHLNDTIATITGQGTEEAPNGYINPDNCY